MQFSTYPLTSVRGDPFRMPFCDKAIVPHILREICDLENWLTHLWWLGVLQYLAVLEKKQANNWFLCSRWGLWSLKRHATTTARLQQEASPIKAGEV